MRKSIIRTSAWVGVFFSMIACGGGGSGGGGGTPVTLTGVVTKGPLRNATVVVYAVDATGHRGAELGRSVSASDGTGSFSVTLPSAPTGPVEVVASGGTYQGESDDADVAQTEPCTAMVASPSASKPIAVNPVTDLVAARARALAQAGAAAGVSDALSKARTDLASSFQFSADVGSLVPSFDVAHASIASGEALKLGLLLVALDAFAQEASPQDRDVVYAALDQDFRDGVLDFDSSVASYGDLSFDAGSIPRGQLFADRLLRTLHQSMAAVVNGYAPAQVVAFASDSAHAASVDLQPDLSAHYSCGAGTQLVFDHDDPVCWDGTTDGSGAPYLGQYWVCGADAYPSDPGTCSDGSIPMLENSTTLAMYHATPITVFVAQEVHLLTAEELAALDAQLASWPLPSWASGPLNSDQAAAVNEMYSSLQGFYAR